MKKLIFLIAISLVLVTTSACFLFRQDSIGNIPTQIPSSAPTMYKAVTPLPDFTYVPYEERKTYERIYVNTGGFSVVPPLGMNYSVSNNFVFLSNENSEIEISVSGFSFINETRDEEEIAWELLSYDTDSIPDEYYLSKGEPVQVDTSTGVLFDFTGKESLSPIHGAVLVAKTVPSQIILMVGKAIIRDGHDVWKEKGEDLLVDVIQSIQIIDLTLPIACTTSNDSTYGYTKDNPIKVGPQVDREFSRVFAYLDNLIGPNGEPLTYERLGSNILDGKILEKYKLNGLSDEIILYFDVDEYSEVKAPIGLTCKAPFILSPLYINPSVQG